MHVKDFVNKAKDVLSMGLKIPFQDSYKSGMRGELFINVYEGDTLLDYFHFKNIVTEKASVMLARLMKNPSEPLNGVYALGVGSGSPSWDPMSPPPATASQVYLVNELARVQFDSINFIKTDGSGEVSPVPTYIIDCTANFPATIGTGPWMELGVFGDTPTPLIPNTGTLVTYRTLAVLNKTPTMSFTVVYRLSF